MTPEIPGTIAVREREFIYFQLFEGEGFREFLDGWTTLPNLTLPKDGGILEELVRVKLPNGKVLLGASYKGDLVGWRTRVSEYCNKTNRVFGTIVNRTFRLSDGTESSIDDCLIEFD